MVLGIRVAQDGFCIRAGRWRRAPGLLAAGLLLVVLPARAAAADAVSGPAVITVIIGAAILLLLTAALYETEVSNEVVHTSLFLAAFSAVSFAASSVNDPRYRESFFEPLVQEVRVTITARNLWYASGVDPTAAPAA